MSLRYIKEAMFVSAYYDLVEDDETGELFWSGFVEGDKDGGDFNFAEPLILRPEHFPIGCKVRVYEPFQEEETNA